jgi:diguanylate cyclase (GGDEF)-like protein
MDYGTYFLTNIASVTVFAVCIDLLAVYNRRVKGMMWLAGAQTLGLVKLILQGLEGKIPVVLTGMNVNELYLISFVMQWIGLRWFVNRTPMRQRWIWSLAVFVVVVHAAMYFFQVPQCGNLINLPFIAICCASAWSMWKHGKGAFKTIARVTALILCAQMAVAAYRAVLTYLYYVRPWQYVMSHTDPRWLYSLAAAAFLAAFMTMCELWFLVTELQRELAEQARTDPLTGALNRRSMEEAALRETARSIRLGSPLSMIVLDIDNFKRLNDTRGHAAGDQVLKVLVSRVKASLRQQDLLARSGGEEFAVLLPGTAEPAALAAAERIRVSIEKMEVPFESEPIRITVCAGVAQFDPDNGWEAMMRQADAAMYEAKQHGRNQVAAHAVFGLRKETPRAALFPSLKPIQIT